ncbi:hypothetical protein ACG7TL_002591 [Trametes sanguinea]
MQGASHNHHGLQAGRKAEASQGMFFAPKKDKKDLDEDEIAFQQRKKQEEAALKAARDKAAKGRNTATDLIDKPSSSDLCIISQEELLVAVSRSLGGGNTAPTSNGTWIAPEWSHGPLTHSLLLFFPLSGVAPPLDADPADVGELGPALPIPISSALP